MAVILAGAAHPITAEEPAEDWPDGPRYFGRPPSDGVKCTTFARKSSMNCLFCLIRARHAPCSGAGGRRGDRDICVDRLIGEGLR
jgi:hypothetical protein